MNIFDSAARSQTPVFRLSEPCKSAYSISKETSAFELSTYILERSSERKAQPPTWEEPLCGGLWFQERVSETQSEESHESNNTPWARARRSRCIWVTWQRGSPSVGQIWGLAYAFFSLCPGSELFKLMLFGDARETLIRELIKTGLAINHPPPSAPPGQPVPLCQEHSEELVILRAAFWQGAGSPFGPKPVWLADDNRSSRSEARTHYPARPLEYTITTKFPDARVHARHPIRPPKPKPGSMIYSRYIPHLDEMFSMVALDWTNTEHLQYFHTWQNEPRVSQSWNETGTLEEHREYLRKVHVDPHQFAVLGQFDGTPFAYFEIYWSKEDHMGAYYDAQDYDRGRHFLVGDERFRGPHRVRAWHTSLTHYMFLDEPRTNAVVGEPKATGAKVLAYDQTYGYHIEKFIDLPHKRAALVKSSRERFFQLMPFGHDGNAT